jgi:hypothetical protein
VHPPKTWQHLPTIVLRVDRCQSSLRLSPLAPPPADCRSRNSSRLASTCRVFTQLLYARPPLHYDDRSPEHCQHPKAMHVDDCGSDCGVGTSSLHIAEGARQTTWMCWAGYSPNVGVFGTLACAERKSRLRYSLCERCSHGWAQEETEVLSNGGKPNNT